MSDTTTTSDEPEKTTPAPATAPVQTSTAPPERSASGGGVLPVLLGGVVAGGIGYLAAYYTEFGLFQNNDASDPLAEISAVLDEQAARLDQIEAVETAAGETDGMADIEGQIGDVVGTLSALADRLDSLEANPPGSGDGAAASLSTEELSALDERVGALESAGADDGVAQSMSEQGGRIDGLASQLEELSGRLDSLAETQQTQAAALEDLRSGVEEAGNSAEREAARISAQGALSALRAAIDTGSSYEAALGELQSAMDVSVPDALASNASDGVPTLASLQSSFPERAREALSASVAETAGDNPVNRFGAFLRAQTNARSLSAQEGDSADAILSRAEARLSEGDIEASLSELEALPGSGQEAMSDWTARARERVSAKAALDELTEAVNSK